MHHYLGKAIQISYGTILRGGGQDLEHKLHILLFDTVEGKLRESVASEALLQVGSAFDHGSMLF